MRERERERTNQPQLRFQGFEDEWKLKNLIDVVDFKNSKSYEKQMKDHGKFELVKMGSLDIESNFKHSGNFIDESDEVLKKDDLFMIMASPPPGNLLGRVGLIPESNKFVLNTHTLLLIPKIESQRFFLWAYLNAKQFYFKKNALGMGAKHMSLLTRNNFPLYIPPKGIEEKLGLLFNLLSQNKKTKNSFLDSVNRLKQALLTKLFINNNSSLPNFRFKGFYDFWQTKQLGDISERVREKNKELKYTETLTCSASAGLVLQKDYFSKSISNINNIDSYYVVEKGDFVYNPTISNLSPAGTIRINNLGIDGIASPLYFVFKVFKKETRSFLSSFFFSKIWNKYILETGVTGVRATIINIGVEDMFKLPISIPSLEEQDKIGKLSKTLDKLINLQNKEINILKELKKTAMKMMLI
ncbi:restriction endonuclease subunit S [Mycoplasma sp. Ms02]|uniref:restriction endonuclease subunit S n=1 Tax=Mycoplasma sp. Ms02 TaxID=353851 RepID=UPI001C8A0AE6|nr:restriction endonuclease subunit S [Mycoplasma sp. Ms02]QZE12500.1 restriction endonuclease subunit S [Mycoplasma sp. Ms02]